MLSHTGCDGFFCSLSQECIDHSLLCNGVSDCPFHEDEPDQCRICIRDMYDLLFGGPFEYFSYDQTVNSFIYKTVSNIYLYSDEYDYYIGINYNDFTNYLYRCTTYKLFSVKLSDCVYWYNPSWTRITGLSISIGCNQCALNCYYSGICLNETEVCDGTRDCHGFSEEEPCSVCLQTTDAQLSYYRSQYTFIEYDNTNNGRIYYDGSYLYIYPYIGIDLNWQYQYFYFIDDDYNNRVDPLAICVINPTLNYYPYSRATYFTLRLDGSFSGEKSKMELCR